MQLSGRPWRRRGGLNVKFAGVVGLVGVLFASLFFLSTPGAVSNPTPAGAACTGTTPVVCVVEGDLIEYCDDDGAFLSPCFVTDLKVPLATAQSCAAAPNPGEAAGPGLICLFEIIDRAEPLIATCTPDPGAVHPAGRAACIDTTAPGPATSLDTTTAADAVSWCRPLRSAPTAEGSSAHLIDWACADRNEQVYHCTTDTSHFGDVDVSDPSLYTWSQLSGGQAQHCDSRTFPPGVLDCTPATTDGTTTCSPVEPVEGQPDRTLHCATFPDPTPETPSNVYGTAMLCANTPPSVPTDQAPAPPTDQAPAPPTDQALDVCAAPTTVHRRQLTESTGLTTLGDLCATSAPGTVAVVQFPDAEGTFGLSDTSRVKVVFSAVTGAGDPAPPLFQDIAAGVDALQKNVAGALAAPTVGSGAVPPVPVVLVVLQPWDESAGGVHDWGSVIVLKLDDIVQPAKLAHEYAHILIRKLGFLPQVPTPQNVLWQLQGLNEGFAVFFGWLAVADLGAPVSEMGPRPGTAASFSQLDAAQNPHHNAGLLVNVMTTLRNSWHPHSRDPHTARDLRLRQLLVETAADPRANAGYAGFRLSMIDAARRLHVPVGLVQAAFAKHGWTATAQLQTCAVGNDGTCLG